MLCEAVARAGRGLIDADLGAGLIKQRVARPGAGRAGGYRTLSFFRAEATIVELVMKHGVHQTVIDTWKRQAIEGMSGVFSGKAEGQAAENEGEIEKLRGPDRPAAGGAGLMG